MSFLLHMFYMLLRYFPKFSCPCKQKIPYVGLRPKEASHFQDKGSSLSSLSMALNHSSSAFMDETAVTAALVSARANLATIPVLQNPREKVVAVSPQVMSLSIAIPSL